MSGISNHNEICQQHFVLLQGLLSANSVCWWNNALNGATKSLIYYGYVNPGALLVGSEPCALEVLRNAWARRVLQPPPGYQIVALGKTILIQNFLIFFNLLWKTVLQMNVANINHI